MKQPLLNRRHILPLVAAAFLLRALIPLGYMPAAWGDGFPVQLCPEGMPAELVKLFGAADSHHHHTHDSHDDPAEASSGSPDHCDFGHLLSPAFLASDVPDMAPAMLAQIFHTVPRPGRFAGMQAAYQSRGPPVLKRS